MNDGLAAFFGAILGGLITGLSQYFILKYNYRSLFAKTVSENRMIWIRTIRGASTKIISIYKVYNERGYEKVEGICQLEVFQMQKEYYENINIIRTRLNPREERHQVLDIYLKNLTLENTLSPVVVEEDMNFFIRDLMKDEWERVKKEAGGNYRE